MNFHYKIEVVEDAKISIEDLVKGRVEENRICLRSYRRRHSYLIRIEPAPQDERSWRALLAKLDYLFRVVEEVIRERRNALRELKVRLEAMPPHLDGPWQTLKGYFYTGQWVGMVFASYEDIAITLLVRPKYRKFPEIYREVKEGFGRVLEPLASFLDKVSLGFGGGVSDIRIAAWLLDRYAEETPYYLVDVAKSWSGSRLILRSGKPVIIRKIVRWNEVFGATVVAGLSMLARALNESKKRLQEIGLPQTLWRLMEDFLREQEEMLQSIAARPYVKDAFLRLLQFEPDIDVLLGLKRLLHVVAPGLGVARMLLIPSPKVYEFYVLLKLVEALKGKPHVSLAGPVEVEVNGAKIYYNEPPKSLSRLISKLSGAVPHPDFLLEIGNELVVLDAKYRLKLRRLSLSDALRLLGYMTDLAKDSVLKGIIVCPSKDSMPYRSSKVTAFLNDRSVEVQIAEVSPNRNELKELLSRYLAT
ncbi:MAG: hypothetical protein DRJ37_06550 [Thermoprotei archaeon]|nr:MAG: hypothetical protein DRJ37_06550 [Thermoprotei archaeon]